MINYLTNNFSENAAYQNQTSNVSFLNYLKFLPNIMFKNMIFNILSTYIKTSKTIIWRNPLFSKKKSREWVIFSEKVNHSVYYRQRWNLNLIYVLCAEDRINVLTRVGGNVCDGGVSDKGCTHEGFVQREMNRICSHRHRRQQEV